MDTEHSDGGDDPKKQKDKYHSAKMDLNLRILRDQMSGLSDEGNSLSRQMASMYRTLKEVKDKNDQEDGSSDEDIDSGDEADISTMTRSMEALDTEDDLNKMSDLESCSYPGKKSTRSHSGSGLCKSPKKLSVCENKQRHNTDDDEITPQPSPNVENGNDFSFPTNKNDNTISPMSLTLTSTDREVNRRNANHHHNHKKHQHHDSDSDDESLPDSSSDECSRCLCCSSLASYQGIPWRIQRRDSATTTEASDSSEYCSDSDTEEGHKKVPLYAKLSPFFFQECYVDDDNETGEDAVFGEEQEKMDEGADSLPDNHRPGPVGCETLSAGEAKVPTSGSSCDSKSTTPVPSKNKEKSADKQETTPTVPCEKQVPEEEEVDEQSSASVLDKIKSFQSKIPPNIQIKKKDKPVKKKKEMKDSSTQSTAESVETQTDVDDEELKTPTPQLSTSPEKEKPKRHVSKSMFLVARPKEGDKKGKTAVLTSPDSLIQIPASCIDKEGRVTLRPDPKLAPEAYKQGKSITFQVRSAGDGTAATDGPLILSGDPRSGNAAEPTVFRMGNQSYRHQTSFEPPPESQVEVTPEGVIKIKRRTVPVRINPVQTITIGDPQQHHNCSHCHNHAPETASTQYMPQSNTIITSSSPQIITRQISTQQNPTQQRRIVISPQGQSQQITIGGPQQHQQGPVRLISVNQPPQNVQYGGNQFVTVRRGGDGAQQQVYQVGGGDTPQRQVYQIGGSQPQTIRFSGGSGQPQTYRIGGGMVPSSQTFTFGGGPQTQTYQISGQPTQQFYQIGGQPSESMSIRMGGGETISIPVQRRQQGMRFVINQ